MVRYIDLLRAAFHALDSVRSRSLLTCLGFGAGVLLTSVAVGLLSGFDRHLSERVEHMVGGREISVARALNITTRKDAERLARRKELREEDADWVRQRCSSCSVVGARRVTQATVRRAASTQSARVFGIDESIEALASAPQVQRGRPIVAADVSAHRPVAVLGSRLAAALFGSSESLGAHLMLNSQPVEVVGVAEPSGELFGQSLDNFVVVPIGFFRHAFSGEGVLMIIAEARSTAVLGEARDEVTGAVRSLHRLAPSEADDFDTISAETLLADWRSAKAKITLASSLIGAITLLGGALIVANLVLMSVSERTVEFGIRRAVGAKRRDLLLQPVIESLMLAFTGTLFGLTGALALLSLISLLIRRLWFAGFAAALPLTWVFIGVATSTVLALLAAAYPAFQASRIDPVVALRQE
jgi:putative ABC transport system permease protein